MSDLNFFHHLDLCQINKTLLKLTFTVFSYSLHILRQLWGSNNLHSWNPFYKGGLTFQNFCKKRRVQVLSHKKEGVGKIEGVVLRNGSITYLHTN